ncbi:hypothetical protein SAMN04488122_2224 [Chitinophaga arvensicola]|uniref:Uncharacterized protein n=1 Tax=Chitinophaga arvensicola TaxID=29529 RepID=A0A1I0R4W0_9BACT|nr:hypothetical protein SAMN04488122_2224 [Chitinophaga arvensicola]
MEFSKMSLRNDEMTAPVFTGALYFIYKINRPSNIP